MMKNITRVLLAPMALAAVALSSSVQAAVPESVTAAITTAQTDLLSLLAALTAAGVAIWVGRVIYNKFKVR